MSKQFVTLTEKFTNYICKNDAKNLANLFTYDGVYNDYIYGCFKGRKNIQSLITEYFHRDGENYFWEMYDLVYKDNLGYAKYHFGFSSKLKDFSGKKVVIPGIGFFKLNNGLIKEYSESVNGGLAMIQLGLSNIKMEKVFLKWFKRILKEDQILKKKLNKLNLK